MLNWLKNKFRPKQLEDPVFGTLLLVNVRGRHTSYWEGRGFFEPVNDCIEYLIQGNEAGPRSSQYALHRLMKERYAEVFRSIKPLLEREFAAACGGVPDDKAVFYLKSLSVPAFESEAMEWEMHFSCSAGDEWLLIVQMRGWKATGEFA